MLDFNYKIVKWNFFKFLVDLVILMECWVEYIFFKLLSINFITTIIIIISKFISICCISGLEVREDRI